MDSRSLYFQQSFPFIIVKEEIVSRNMSEIDNDMYNNDLTLASSSLFLPVKLL